MFIRAPFFTYDGDVEAGLFTLRQYARLWPEIPLEFIIPFTDPSIRNRYRRELPDRLKFSFIQTDTSLHTGFPSWVDNILLDTKDPWFFWCSSDRYPIAMASNPVLQRIINGLPTLSAKVDAVRIARWKDSYGEESFEIQEFGGVNFSTRPLAAHGLWHPQFLSRRHLAWVAQVAAEFQPTGMQVFNQALMADLPRQNFKGFFPRKALVKLEEPTYSGKSTLNFLYRCHLEGQPSACPSGKSPLWVSFSSSSARNRNEFWLKAQTLQSTTLSDSVKPIRSLFERKFPEVPRMVVTFGGCGSKFILQNLYLGEMKRNLGAAHSHWRVPPMTIRSGQKVLYIFGDPRNAIISFFQRRLSKTELHGFGSGVKRGQERAQVHQRKDWVLRALCNLETDSGSLDEGWDLETFLSHDLDLFRLEEHFDNWAFSMLPYPVVFCRYESVWDHWDQLCEILEIPVKPLPSPQKRRANWQALPDVQQGQLNRMYGDFARR